MTAPASDGSFRRWAPIAVAGLAMVLCGGRAATWALMDQPADLRLTPLGERLYVACLVSLPVLPALALFVLLFNRRRTRSSVLTVVAMLALGLAGAVFGLEQRWELFGWSPVATVPSPDGSQEAHLFTGGLVCTSLLCVSEPRAVWCREVEKRGDLKCQTERIEWQADGTPKLTGEAAEPLNLFLWH